MNNYTTEAQRYLMNAKALLKEKAGKKNRYYTDAKYVKRAGDTAYKGILMALDSIYGKKAKGCKDVDWYRQNIDKNNKKLRLPFLTAYNVLHVSMGYNGELSYKVAQTGLGKKQKKL